ncbi:MarR family winged helix-turn-helix transcriptional regulator [Streptomyces sp. NPDC058401]|uniref:MarR family winged helix-turn-helix transcriptional regulator n=1 Tax=Streptomyces sp. NPDC058401 TaxID=3346480 RepID=UPI00364C14E5
MDEFVLAEQMLTCVTRIRRILDERLKAHGVSVARGRALRQVAHGPARQAALAAALGVTPRTITEMIDGLERDGLAERRDDPKDRRARLVYITAAGKKAIGLAMATRAEVITEIFSDLSAQDRTALSQALTTIGDRVTAMTTAPDPDAFPYGEGSLLTILGTEGQ